jgi:hypothetical protein
MAQFRFFDADNRFAALSAKGDPSNRSTGVMETFRADIEAADTGRDEKPLDVMRLGIGDSIPDATTLWREKLVKAGLIEKLFDRFDQHLAETAPGGR